MHPGDAMIISDHINVLKRHPLQGLVLNFINIVDFNCYCYLEVFGDDSVCPTNPSNQIYRFVKKKFSQKYG